jgi:hypothetical protein
VKRAKQNVLWEDKGTVWSWMLFSSDEVHFNDILSWNRLVTTQLSLPATAKVEGGNSGVTATSAQNFGGGQFSSTLLEFWPSSLMMVKYSSGARYTLLCDCLCRIWPVNSFDLLASISISMVHLIWHNICFCQVTTTIYNLILGKVYCDHHGMMHIQGNRQYSCKLKFKEQSILDRNPHQVRRC